MLHPSQFQVNDAWIVFKLNDVPIETEKDGSFDCICLMDAASRYILGNTLVATTASEPSTLEARRLLKTGWNRSTQLPSTLVVPTGQFPTKLRAEAKRQGIAVVLVDESELLTWIDDARKGFREYLERRHPVSEA